MFTTTEIHLKVWKMALYVASDDTYRPEAPKIWHNIALKCSPFHRSEIVQQR